MYEVLTIGSATVDVFVECDDAGIVTVNLKDKKAEFMSYPYGSKIEINEFDTQVGGGGINTAVNFANLGLKTASIFKIGDDIYSKGILKYFENNNVDLDYIIQDDDEDTGFSIILTSFQGDRTVLAHRGANAHIKKSEINFDVIKKSKLLYIAPLNGDSNKVLDDIVKYAKEHNTIVCFNAGSTGIKKGFDYLKKILSMADVVVMNREEAVMATGINIRPDTSEEKFSVEKIHPDLKHIFKKLKVSDYQVIVITDGGHGAYAYDGKKYYFCPCFEGKVVSTLGAGDAFASTFCAALLKYGINIPNALKAASINSTSVVSKFGATTGLLTVDEIFERMNKTHEFKCQIIES